MSTYYLLPTRRVLADQFADFLQTFLPGIDLNVTVRDQLLDSLCSGLVLRDVYLIHRDELPEGELPEKALVDGFGAAPGDEVVEVRHAARPGVFVSRRWRLGESSTLTGAA